MSVLSIFTLIIGGCVSILSFVVILAGVINCRTFFGLIGGLFIILGALKMGNQYNEQQNNEKVSEGYEAAKLGIESGGNPYIGNNVDHAKAWLEGYKKFLEEQ